MASAAVLSPLLLQQQARRVEALEIQRYSCPATTAGEEQQGGSNDNAVVVVVDEQMRRARTAVEEAGLYSSVWTWVPSDYYTSWSLQARADYLLKVPNANVDYLCKSLLLENKKVSQDDVNNSSPMDRTNPKYILVVLQYAATLDVKKLITAIRAMRQNVHERLEEHQFDVRVATPEDNAILTGYEHNSVTPFGLLQPHRILIVLSKEVVPLRRFWMGGGHVNLKLSMTVSDFLKSDLNPMIANISNPRTTRTGLELKNYTTLVDAAVGVLPHTESSSSSTANGGGGAAAPAGNGGTSTPSLAINQQPDDAANYMAAAAAPAMTEQLIKEKKHKKRHKDKDKKKHRSSSSKKDKHNPDSTPSSSCASQTSEESKEKKVGEGYIVHVQWDDMDDDHSAITSPALKKKKDKDKKKKKKHRSMTVLEEGGGVIVEESTTTSSSNKSHQSKDDHSASEPSSSAAESPKSSTKSPPPAAASSDHQPIMVPALPNNSNNDDDEDSPGKMHRFHFVDTAPALPVVPVPVAVQAQKPKIGTSRAMSSDLQAIMKRRREMAETLSSDNVPTAALMDTTSTAKSHCGSSDALIRNKSLDRRLKTVGMSSDLQAIMARRRRLAGDADDDDEND